MAPRLMSPAFMSDEKKALPAEYTQSKVIIWPISFGQTTDFIAHKGTETLRLLAAHNGPTYIIPTHTLARHNYEVENDLNPTAALTRSKEEGCKWMEWFNAEQKPARNKSNDSNKIADAQVLDWDYWQRQAGYQALAQKVERLYTENQDGFRDVVVTTAADFARNKIKHFPGKMGLLHNASVAYLKEETIVTLLWVQMLQQQHPNTAIVQLYPKDPNPVLVHLYNKILTVEQRKFFEFATIDFNDKKLAATKSAESHANTSESGSPQQHGSPQLEDLSKFYMAQLEAYRELLAAQTVQIQFQNQQIATLMNRVFSPATQQQHPSYTAFQPFTLNAYGGATEPAGNSNAVSPITGNNPTTVTSPRIAAGGSSNFLFTK